MTDRPDAEAPNADQIAFWNETGAAAWVALHDRLDRQIEPLGRRALASLAPQAGERIIDVGCGCGQTTLALAESVGPEGWALGADVSRPMLEVARRRAAEAGLSQAHFEEADAQTYTFEPGGADAVFSRFGVMFFADPVAAFANLRRALRPGGRMAFVCWRSMPENRWMTVPLGAALAHLPPPEPTAPGAPGPFAFADPARVESILEAAGFEAVRLTPHDERIGGGDLEQTVETTMRIGPLGALLRENPERAPAVVDSVCVALAPHIEDGVVRLDSATWIVEAARR